MPAKYDEISEFYYEFVQRGLAQPSHITSSVSTVLTLLGDLHGRTICDLACGEGHLSRLLAQQGATVTGVDLSAKLLDYAREQAVEAKLDIKFVQDDAQTLAHLTQTFDAAVCHMALMDIPDLVATFQAVHRILKPQSVFVFAVLHPCFETPFTAPNGIIEADEAGNFAAVRVMRYTEEGYWNSGGTGIRGRVGAHHRMLSTYINTLLDTGFQVSQLAEPTLIPSPDDQSLSAQWGAAIPRILLVKSIKTG